jgi:hypothetical protein
MPRADRHPISTLYRADGPEKLPRAYVAALRFLAHPCAERSSSPKVRPASTLLHELYVLGLVSLGGPDTALLSTSGWAVLAAHDVPTASRFRREAPPPVCEARARLARALKVDPVLVACTDCHSGRLAVCLSRVGRSVAFAIPRAVTIGDAAPTSPTPEVVRA